jgi:hypothetical protein
MTINKINQENINECPGYQAEPDQILPRLLKPNTKLKSKRKQMKTRAKRLEKTKLIVAVVFRTWDYGLETSPRNSRWN